MLRFVSNHAPRPRKQAKNKNKRERRQPNQPRLLSSFCQFISLTRGGGAKPILTGELKRSKITRSVYEAKMVLAVVPGKKRKKNGSK